MKPRDSLLGRSGLRLRQGWRLAHLVGAIVMFALAIGATWGTWADTVRKAVGDEEASHIFLVPGVFAWLVWVRRERLAFCLPRGQWVGIAIVALGAVTTEFGYHNAYLSLWHGGAVLIVVGAVLSVLGADVGKALLAAFCVLPFIVPVPGSIRAQIATPLQSGTAWLTHGALAMLGTASDLQGSQVVVNGRPINVVEACNGLRMVFALILVSYAFVFGTPTRPFVRAIILIASPISAMLCNLIRLVPTAWVYGHFNEKVGETFHDWAGWAMLVVAFLLLMSIVRLLRWALLPVHRYTLAYD